MKDGYKKVIISLEKLASEIQMSNSNETILKKTLVHELFIYIISYYLKQSNNKALQYILNRTYFIRSFDFNKNDSSFYAFYNKDSRNLDHAVCLKDGKKYYSGTANLWMELINMNICTKSEFVIGDWLSYNCSFLVSNYDTSWKWFPITYPYGLEERPNLFRNYALKLKALEHLKEVAYIMGFDSIKEFTEKYAEIEEKFANRELKEYRYNSSFDSAQSFWSSISSEELGTRN
ncbi:MAG: hypothetical protein GX660_19375 [Clostridiaceae bacterium]|nr:hypothetical protein [Clostridiaceae bacterium]